ncbi:hypothetical protein PTNB85_07824 [Pyrenophora teres f. teres]|uniref:Uncharacterized protein n=1 Tax=Pyrenophora teres f. teres TaxID=97479 RepID=A0A6S6W9L4_9PLEO|nr:hypothetical protein PTNB85_07824 [Pyrenophora teres f. teres]KAE8859966.1 hypothetical protein PTNB29_07197 [Pyrenophora teres f. teres]CAE7199606.1 hypothetical protein PTTW11_08487 [Pyrenophora teres f. teres]
MSILRLVLIATSLALVHGDIIFEGTDTCCGNLLDKCLTHDGAHGYGYSGGAICVDNNGPTSTCSGVCTSNFDYAWQIHGAPEGDCLCTDYDPTLSHYCYS